MPRKPLTPIEFLTRPAASPADVRKGMPLDSWPGVTRRALSDQEKDWLAELDAMPSPLWVQYEGQRMPYERGYLRLRVQDALERGKGHVSRGDAGQLVAMLPNGLHTVLACAGENAQAGSAPPDVRDPARAHNLTGSSSLRTGQGAAAAGCQPRAPQGGTNTGARGPSFFSAGGKGGTYASHTAREDD